MNKMLIIIPIIGLISIFIFLLYCGMSYGLLAALEIIVFRSVGKFTLDFLLVFALLVFEVLGFLYLYNIYKGDN